MKDPFKSPTVHCCLSAVIWLPLRHSFDISDFTWWLCCLKLIATLLFVQQPVQLTIKTNITAPSFWPFVRDIHWSPVDYPHTGPVMLKAFPNYDVKLWCWFVWWFSCSNCMLPLVQKKCVPNLMMLSSLGCYHADILIHLLYNLINMVGRFCIQSCDDTSDFLLSTLHKYQHFYS